MTLAKIEDLTVTVRKTVNAPLEKVWKGFTEPAQMVKWFGCDRVTNIQISQDFRVGGKYRIEGDNREEGDKVAVYGIFKEIIENKKVVYTWSNESKVYPAENTVVSAEFIAKGDSTEIVVEHTKFASEKAKEGHTQGWTQSLDKFATLFAG
jgi:uncharacterized protein YndB with AHSA1/START domain